MAVHPPKAPAWLRALYIVEPSIAAVLLILLAPLMAAIAITIMALSRRNPFIRHRRVGWGGVRLDMLKFRTMWDRETPGPQTARPRLFLIENVSGASRHKTPRDARVRGRFAAFCRKYSLDELPQLYHVTRGEMSLVGPRPITLAELNDYYGRSAAEVVSVRPGMTGLWQVKGRSRLSYAKRKRFDLFFVRRGSLALYFRILLRSVSEVLSGRGAY